MKTAVIGAHGYIGRHLLESLRMDAADCVGTTRRAVPGDLKHLDLESPDIQKLKLRQTGHEAAVIAAALPRIDECENESSRRINVAGTLEAVRQLVEEGLFVVFLSTDYVFEGREGGYSDESPTEPTTSYGRQKVEVERAIAAMTEQHLILRLSKIFGVVKGDRTLLDEMATLLAAGRTVRAAFDQIFCPTRIEDVVRCIRLLLAAGLRGRMNVCSSETWARHEIAVRLADAMGMDRRLVSRVSLDEIPAAVVRPKNTSMVCGRLPREMSAAFTPMVESINRVADNYSSVEGLR